jgi:hypothetical protein
MPRKKTVRGHGTQAGEQTNTELYKKLDNYKKLKIIDDDLNRAIEDIYNNNNWNLKTKFEELKLYYEQIGISDEVSWYNGIQYLDFIPPLAIRQTSLQKLKNGDYRAMGVDKPNSIVTEKKYYNRMLFFMKTFEPFKQYKDYDDFSWVLQNNRLLFYEILKYHNDHQNQLSSVNNDLKAIIRVLKIILTNPEKEEIRWKYSALQIAIGDIDRLKDDLNEISSVNELKSFIPYEQLMDLVDRMELNYNNTVSQLPNSIKNDYEKHPNDVVYLNQLLIAVAIMVFDYPSRLDKYDMKILNDESLVQPDKCYVLTTDPLTFIFNNDKKKHKPLKYRLNAQPITGLNKRLNKLIIDSLTKYPRNTLFFKKDTWANKQLTPVNEDTVAGWIKDLIPTKTLNVSTFRSSFVSYYYPKSNNQAKQIMIKRMRTSQGELVRAYLKFYTSPDNLVKVKVEPTEDLINRANSGQINTPILLENSMRIYEEVQGQIVLNAPIRNTNIRTSSNEKKRLNSIEWYKKNKEHHLEKVRSYVNRPDVVRKRYIRELNTGLIDYTKVKEETFKKYNIEFDTINNVFY